MKITLNVISFTNWNFSCQLDLKRIQPTEVWQRTNWTEFDGRKQMEQSRTKTNEIFDYTVTFIRKQRCGLDLADSVAILLGEKIAGSVLISGKFRQTENRWPSIVFLIDPFGNQHTRMEVVNNSGENIVVYLIQNPTRCVWSILAIINSERNKKMSGFKLTNGFRYSKATETFAVKIDNAFDSLLNTTIFPTPS